QALVMFGRKNTFKTVYSKYSDVVNFEIPEERRHDEGKGLVVFNSGCFLEIAVSRSTPNTVGTASSLMGLDLMDTVTINFMATPIVPPVKETVGTLEGYRS